MNFPIIFKVVSVEPLHSLRAGGEWVCLEYVVEEGGVLFPYFIGLVDGDETVLIVIYHFLNRFCYIKSRWE